MGEMLHELSSEGLGTGWFGFLYSLTFAPFIEWSRNDILLAQTLNLVLLNISALLLYTITKKLFQANIWRLLVVGIFLLSPVYLHFSIHVLSENLYIPLFL